MQVNVAKFSRCESLVINFHSFKLAETCNTFWIEDHWCIKRLDSSHAFKHDSLLLNHLLEACKQPYPVERKTHIDQQRKLT